MSKQPVPASLSGLEIVAVPESQPRSSKEEVQGPPVRTGRVALTLRIRPELHRELRAAAYQADTTIQELILLALQRDGYKEASSDAR